MAAAARKRVRRSTPRLPLGIDRARVVAIVDALVALLDELGTDADLEPSLVSVETSARYGESMDQRLWGFGRTDDREPDGDEGDHSGCEDDYPGGLHYVRERPSRAPVLLARRQLKRLIAAKSGPED